MINFIILLAFAAFSVWMFGAGFREGHVSGHIAGFESGKLVTPQVGHFGQITQDGFLIYDQQGVLIPGNPVSEIIRAQNALLSDDDRMVVALQWPEVLAIVKEGEADD